MYCYKSIPSIYSLNYYRENTSLYRFVEKPRPYGENFFQLFPLEFWIEFEMDTPVLHHGAKLQHI